MEFRDSEGQRFCGLLTSLKTTLVTSVLLAVAGLCAGAAESPASPAPFPVAVWYGGGKARAPMLALGPKVGREVRASGGALRIRQE